MFARAFIGYHDKLHLVSLLEHFIVVHLASMKEQLLASLDLIAKEPKRA